MDAADQYIAQLIQHKAQAQAYTEAWCAIAAAMQQFADNTGQGFGLVPLTPDLPFPVLQQVARQLGQRLTPPNGEYANGHDGMRVPVGAGAGKDESDEE